MLSNKHFQFLPFTLAQSFLSSVTVTNSILAMAEGEVEPGELVGKRKKKLVLKTEVKEDVGMEKEVEVKTEVGVDLVHHVSRYHKTEAHNCQWAGCTKTYRHRWDLASHISVVHKGKRVVCPHCGSCFSKKSNLYNHLHRYKGCPRRLSLTKTPPSHSMLEELSADQENLEDLDLCLDLGLSLNLDFDDLVIDLGDQEGR